ncbi:hypothetical protein ACFJIV_05455 [Mucilaginibacter sp. UC70_90]
MNKAADGKLVYDASKNSRITNSYSIATILSPPQMAASTRLFCPMVPWFG